MDPAVPPRTTAEWLDACRDELIGFCERYLGQVADAEDVVQDVGAAMSRQTGIENPRAWMFRAARNRCLNVLRDRRADPGGTLIESDLVSPRTGPRTALDRDERHAALRAALAELPPRLAEVLSLRYFEGFGRGDIAAVVERSELEVKGELVRARLELARKLRSLESRP